MQLFAFDPGSFGAAFDGERIVGTVMPELKVTVVRPELRRRGIGRRLVDLGLSMQAARDRRELFMGTVPDVPGGAAFARATGFTFHSTTWSLALPAERTVPEPVWPDEVAARPFDSTRDVAGLPAIVNLAFQDHPTPMTMSEEMVRASLDDPNILDADAVLLESRATGALVGFCLTDVRRTDGVVASPHGEVSMVGVHPEWRGRGLGRQLLRAGSRYLREVGAPDVTLSVNGRNEGALALYESEGFVRGGARDRWVRAVPAAPR